MDQKYESLKNKLLLIVNEIVNNSLCPECDNYSQTIECPNCKYENKKLKALYADLELTLLELKPYIKTNIKEISLILFALRNYDIKIIEKINLDYEIENDITSIINIIVNKINNKKELNQTEINILSTLLITKAVNNEIINNYIILGCLNKTNTFNAKVIESVICMFAETMFEAKTMNLKCGIKEFKKSRGVSIRNHIWLDSKEVKSLLEGKMDAFFTLFHEYIHVCQYYRQVILQSASVEDIKQIKETIIAHYNKLFYENNRFVCSYEKEANIMGNAYLIKYLDSVSFPIISFDEIKRIVSNDVRHIADDYRVIGDDIVLIDDEFNRVVKPSDFNSYPQLAYEYKIDKSRVIQKSLEEIYSDVEYINASNDYSNQEKKLLIDIYKDIISRYPTKKKSK